MFAEKNRRVLVIDDNRAIHDDFRKILTPATAAANALDATETAVFGPSAKAVPQTSFQVDSAYQGEEGFQLLKSALDAGWPYAVAFVDVRMPPGWDGVETTQKMWELDPSLQVVLCTAYSDYSWGEMFEKLGQRDGLLILKKPFDAVEAFQLAHALTEKWWLHLLSRRKMEELESIVAGRTRELAHSLSLLNATLESTTDGIVAVDLAGKVVSYNARFAATWQFPSGMLARRDAAEMRAHTAGQAKDSSKFLQRIEELQADPETEGFDVIELKDGRTFERYVFPQRLDHECVGSVISWRDITERKRAEEELQWKTAFLEAQVNASLDGILVVDSNGRKILQSQRASELLRIPTLIADNQDDEKQLRWVAELVKNPEQFFAKVAYLNSHPNETSRDEIEFKDGIVLDRYSSPVVGAEGKYYGRIWTFRDVTERKQAENALRESNEKFHQLANNITDAFWIRSPDLRELHYLSPAFEQIWGRSVASLEANPQQWADFILPEDRDRVLDAFAALQGATRSLDIEYRIVRPDGERRWVRVRGFQIRNGAGEPVRHTGIVTDITERKQAEIAAQAVSKLGHRLSSASSAGQGFDIIREVTKEFFGWDAFCIRLYSAKSDSFYSGVAIDTIAGQPVVEEQSEAVRPGELYRRIIKHGGELILRDEPTDEVPGLVPFGDTARRSATLMFVPIRSHGGVAGILSIQSYRRNAYNPGDLLTLQSLADQCSGAFERIWADEALRKSKTQLFESQKMETVGKLAGGIAHEFNSILTAIIGQSELLLGELPPGGSLAKSTTEIHKAALRAAALTRQLLAYGRKQFLQPETLDLNQVIASMEAMLRHLMGADVDVRIVPAKNLQAVKADAGQIEQVIMNMAINARDAMPRGGKLTLETANVSFAADNIGNYAELEPGDYVMLAITDTGMGMSAEVKARTFEPFFSTKGVGQGTGLGLSTCYGIIKQSGGHISVYSELARGATFKIYLPQVAPLAKVPLQRLDSPELPRGMETILLAEDDPALREMAATLLRRLGYTVFTAANGIEALSLNQQAGIGHIDLLFTDVVMPQMSGKELSERVRALFPHTRILFTSAYTENAIMHQGVLGRGVVLLQKPFTPSALALKVREVLDEPGWPNPDPNQKTFGFTKYLDPGKSPGS